MQCECRYCQLENVIAALERLYDAPIETHGTCVTPAVIENCNHSFEFVALLLFWWEVLSYIDLIQQCLEAKQNTSHHALNHLGTSIDLIDNSKK
jgi:hypothetical protein